MIAAMVMHPASASADSWQENLLFSPTPAQLEVEQSRNRIMIYHGLKDVQVAEAMDQHFDRIEHMMFTGTVVTDGQGEALIDEKTGEARVEDDGC
jgi:hypothetical protein